MRKLVLILSICLSFSGCGGPKEEPAPTIDGTWVRSIRGQEDRTEGLCLGPGGNLGFIGIHSMTGLTWEVSGDTLTLATNTGRYPDPQESRAPITKLTADSLVIGEGAGYLSGTYTRDDAAAGQITGTVRYRERIALPENASIHLTLREVTADGPSRFVANQTTPTQGRQVPIPFHITYATASIDSLKFYHLEALIVINGDPHFTAASTRPVLTRGNPSTSTIIMHSVPDSTPSLRLKGTYTYLADAGVYVDCMTGLQFPVLQDGENGALETAYLEARSKPGEPLLVIMSGRIVLASPMEGEGRHRMVYVEKFLKVLPGETCTSIP